MSMMRRPPVRCQAVADSLLASSRAAASAAGISAAASARDYVRRSSIGCGDIPTESLLLNQDYVVINKPADVRMTGDFKVTVEKLIRHWCTTLADKDLKWVHQLDFATSGVLCVALHKDAASRACEAFRERRASKTYLAVLEGIVDAEAVPCREEEPIGWGEGVDGRNASGRKRKPHADKLLQAIQQGNTLSAEDAKFARYTWADIKFDGTASRPFHDAAKAEKARIMAAAVEAEFRAAQGAPDRGVFRAPGDASGTFRVDASVSEIRGDFRMRLDEGPGQGGKACRTIIQVLEKGSYRGQAVTKVLLRPHTGRRHQLRLHALHIGHPILGDATYAGEDETIPRMCLHAQSLRLRLAPPAPLDTASTSPAPPPGAEDDGADAAATRVDTATEAVGGDPGKRGSGLRHKGRPAWPAGRALVGEECVMEAVAPDPFVFVDGELRL